MKKLIGAVLCRLNRHDRIRALDDIGLRSVSVFGDACFEIRKLHVECGRCGVRLG